MIRALLRRHPEERISSEDLLHHPWFTKENFRESVRACTDQMVPLGVPKRDNGEGDGEVEDADVELMDEDDEEGEGERSAQEVVTAEGFEDVDRVHGVPVLLDMGRRLRR